MPPEALQGATIEFWHPWPGELGEAVRAAVADFNAGNEHGLSVSEVYQGNYNQLYTRVDEALAAGNPPDLVVAYNYQLAAWEAALADLRPFVADPTWGLPADEQADFYPVFWEQDVLDGVRLGFPAQRSALLLYYNQTWARALGFAAPPQSPEDFKEQACAAALANRLDSDPENDRTGGWVVNTSPGGMLSWMYAFGSEIVPEDGEGYRFETPETAAALSFLKDLYDNGCAWKLDRSDTAVGFAQGEFAGAEFAARQALFATGSLAELPAQATAMQAAGNRDEWTVIAFPSPGGQPVMDVFGPSFAIFQNSAEEQMAAWLFVRWLAQPEQGARLAQAGNTFPLRAAAAEALAEYADGHPQWAAALALLPYARSEPAGASWSAVRWVVADVGTQLFRSYFTAERIPATLELMEATAAELHGQSR
jgi:ABC-type glycerol-3-phosphate transport system substrate-binding protein